MSNLFIIARFLYLILILLCAAPIAFGILIVWGGIGLANTINEYFE